MWQQMLEAVQTVHRAKVIHGDLKPSNFLFVGGKLKLIDFGIAMSIGDQSTTSIERAQRVGTINYMAPESIKQQPSPSNDQSAHYKQGRSADVWSLGCILYQLVYGHAILPDGDLFDKISIISDDRYRIEFPFIYGRNDFLGLRSVMMLCLRRNPKKRATIDELLKHPYLTLEPKDVADDLVRFICEIQENYIDFDFDTGRGRHRLARVRKQLLQGEMVSLSCCLFLSSISMS
jgi:serine/threonine-protein kinase TTK/MPS1